VIMERFLFMRVLLERLAQSAFLNRATAVVLRVLGALIVLFSLTTFFKVGQLIFKLPTNSILGGVLFEVFFILAVYAVVHVLLIRAREIDGLQAGELHALPLAPILLRAAGEAYAAFVVLIAIGGGIFVWFTSLKLTNVMNPLIQALVPTTRADVSFMGGIEFMLSGVLAGIAALIAGYVGADVFRLLLRDRRPVPEVVRTNGDNGYKTRFGGQ